MSGVIVADVAGRAGPPTGPATGHPSRGREPGRSVVLQLRPDRPALRGVHVPAHQGRPCGGRDPGRRRGLPELRRLQRGGEGGRYGDLTPRVALTQGWGRRPSGRGMRTRPAGAVAEGGAGRLAVPLGGAARAGEQRRDGDHRQRPRQRAQGPSSGASRASRSSATGRRRCVRERAGHRRRTTPQLSGRGAEEPLRVRRAHRAQVIADDGRPRGTSDAGRGLRDVADGHREAAPAPRRTPRRCAAGRRTARGCSRPPAARRPGRRRRVPSRAAPWKNAPTTPRATAPASASPATARRTGVADARCAADGRAARRARGRRARRRGRTRGARTPSASAVQVAGRPPPRGPRS